MTSEHEYEYTAFDINYITFGYDYVYPYVAIGGGSTVSNKAAIIVVSQGPEEVPTSHDVEFAKEFSVNPFADSDAQIVGVSDIKFNDVDDEQLLAALILNSSTVNEIYLV